MTTMTRHQLLLLSLTTITIITTTTTTTMASYADRTIRTYEDLQQSMSDLPTCPAWTELGIPLFHHPEYYEENVTPTIEKKRNDFLNKMYLDELVRVPPEQTWWCPSINDTRYIDEDVNYEDGPLEVSILHNGASVPVVLSWENHMEDWKNVSPFDSEIPTPLDPRAILQPNDWTHFWGFQGHVFNIREVITLPNGEIAMGRVMMRHRVGLVPIRNRSNFDCKNLVNKFLGEKMDEGRDANANANSMRQEARSKQQLHDDDNNGNNDNHNHRYSWNPWGDGDLNIDPVNVLHKGFINHVGCPVDVYWAGSEKIMQTKEELAIKMMNRNDNDEDEEDVFSYTEPTCQEEYVFHLGLNIGYQEKDDKLAWDTPVAYHGGYLGHRYVARLRDYPGIVVDEMVLEPIVVVDCPSEFGGSGVYEPQPQSPPTKSKKTKEDDTNDDGKVVMGNPIKLDFANVDHLDLPNGTTIIETM